MCDAMPPVPPNAHLIEACPFDWRRSDGSCPLDQHGPRSKMIKCEPPFKSAGGHFNPTEAEHGLLNEAGMHAGDLPNIVMPEGKLELQYFNPRVSLIEGNENNLLDEDGAAIVIHRGADDYESNPAGKAGKRIACGVLEG